jgi:DNA polymerase III alpha subunit (gram-positive type)
MDEQYLRFDKEKEYVFLDCETLNLCLNSCHNLPWQIGMIKLKADKIIATKNFYIKWDTQLKISADAARITKFSPKALEERGLPPEEVFPTMQDWLDNCDYIVGHNFLGFDLYLLKDFYEYMNEPYRHLVRKVIDTNCIAKGLKFGHYYKAGDDFLEYQYKMYSLRKKGVRTNLTSLGKEYEIKHDYESLHDAVVDLELNVKVWNKIKWMVEL